jgi:hypothetical protein
MKRITAVLLLFTVAACSSPLGTEPIGPSDAVGASTQAKPVTNLAVELLSGDCSSGITVGITGQNLSPKARLLELWIWTNDNSGFKAFSASLGAKSRKNLDITVVVPAAAINPAAGPKFTGEVSVIVTDANTGWVHNITEMIGPVCG